MEHTPTPNSGPEKGENYFNRQSPDIGPDNNDNDNDVEIKFVNVHNTTGIWEGPRYPAYNSKVARLETYTGWPHGINPSPNSLSTAGFYFLGMRPVIEIKKI
jgi:hypothetical protein